VGRDHLGANAVETAKINTAAVTKEKLGLKAVGKGQLQSLKHI
jgi:hypothetical protein